MSETLGAVIFVDDDAALRAANVQSLELAGFEARPFARAEAALQAIDVDFPGVVITDVRMPGMDGLALFRRLQTLDPDLPVVLITGHGDIAMAVQAMREGAYDFLAKPYPVDRLTLTVRRALENRRLVLENRRLRQTLAEAETQGPLIGTTPVMERLRETLRHVADAEVDVLIEGETGSGKEVVARLLHRLSRRRGQPFVPVSCAALPSQLIESDLFGHEVGAFPGAVRKRVGLIEHADRGSLFLDDVDVIPQEAQRKLLRVLEERAIIPLGSNEPRAVDVRVLAASKTDLSAAVRSGAVLADFYYRVNVVRLHVPPLRERRADIPLLFAHFAARAAERLRCAPPKLTDAIRGRLERHDWPGNVRELAHFAERVVLGLEDLSFDAQASRQTLAARMEAHEADLIREALLMHEGDVTKVLDALGLPRKTFYDKAKRHGLRIADFRRSSRKAPD